MITPPDPPVLPPDPPSAATPDPDLDLVDEWRPPTEEAERLDEIVEELGAQAVRRLLGKEISHDDVKRLRNDGTLDDDKMELVRDRIFDPDLNRKLKKRRKLSPTEKALRKVKKQLLESTASYPRENGHFIGLLLDGKRLFDAALGKRTYRFAGWTCDDEAIKRTFRVVGYHLPEAQWGDVREVARKSLYAMEDLTVDAAKIRTQEIRIHGAAEKAFRGGQAARAKWDAAQEAAERAKHEQQLAILYRRGR